MGRDDAHQAGEAHGHKRHGTRDTVRFPVKVKPMRCTFDLCTYNATAHWTTGTQEELLFVLEEHVSTDHPLHTAELVNGYVTRHAHLQGAGVWLQEGHQGLPVHIRG